MSDRSEWGILLAENTGVVLSDERIGLSSRYA